MTTLRKRGEDGHGGAVPLRRAKREFAIERRMWWLLFGGFFAGDEVDLFEEGAFLPSGAGEDAHAVFAHAGVAAEVAGGVGGLEIPFVGVFADEVVDAPGFAVPVGVFPRAADRRDIFKPGNFGGDAFEFFAVAEFPRAAAALEAVELVVTGHGAVAFLPILIQGADVADEGRDAGDGGEQQVVGAAAAKVEGEAAFRYFAAVELVAFLQFVEERCQFALRDELDEKFEETFFVRRRDDRVGALDALFAAVDAECGVLTRFEGKWPARIDFYQPQIFG